MELRNFMETIVEQYVNKVLPNAGICGCEKCRLDIMSLALNKLTPQYIVTETGAVFAKVKQLDAQNEVDVMAAVAEAMAIVGNSPKH